jgi:hypothetical protein
MPYTIASRPQATITAKAVMESSILMERAAETPVRRKVARI